MKEKQKATKQLLTEEKLKIDARVASNEKIQESIESLKIRSSAWTKQKEEDIVSFREAIAELEKVDSEIEIETQEIAETQRDADRTEEPGEREGIPRGFTDQGRKHSGQDREGPGVRGSGQVSHM